MDQGWALNVDVKGHLRTLSICDSLLKTLGL